jgi:hypothetical protein
MTNSTLPNPESGCRRSLNRSKGATTSGLVAAPEYSPNIPNVGPYAIPPFAYLGTEAIAAIIVATAAIPMAIPTNGIDAYVDNVFAAAFATFAFVFAFVTTVSAAFTPIRAARVGMD